MVREVILFPVFMVYILQIARHPALLLEERKLIWKISPAILKAFLITTAEITIIQAAGQAIPFAPVWKIFMTVREQPIIHAVRERVLSAVRVNSFPCKANDYKIFRFYFNRADCSFVCCGSYLCYRYCGFCFIQSNPSVKYNGRGYCKYV